MMKLIYLSILVFLGSSNLVYGQDSAQFGIPLCVAPGTTVTYTHLMNLLLQLN